MTKYLLAMLLATQAWASNKEPDQIVLSKDNLIVFDGEVGGETVTKLITAARQLDASLKSGYPIILFMDTPGGSITAGMEAIEALRPLNRPVKTLTSFAASMGFQMVQGLDERLILSTGVLMSHKASGGIQGEFGDGASQLDSRYSLWLRIIRSLDEIAVARTGGKQTLASYRAAYSPELWLFGDEAVKGGYADRVVSARCDASLVGTYDRELYFMGIRVVLKMSNCPLARYPEDIAVELRTRTGFMRDRDFLARGGVMGKTCDSANTSYGYSVSSYDQWGFATGGSSLYGPQPQAQTKLPSEAPCLLDEGVTMEYLDKRRAEVIQQLSLEGKRKSAKPYW